MIAAGRDTNRIVVTYDHRGFTDMTGHVGVFIAKETMTPREVRRTVERVERAYPSLENVVEFLADWC